MCNDKLILVNIEQEDNKLLNERDKKQNKYQQF